MAKFEKLIAKLISNPVDFTWEELVKLLGYFGFTELKKGKTGGSRRKFVDDKNFMISLHKPHPGSILKHYQIKDVINVLKEKGLIKNE